MNNAGLNLDDKKWSTLEGGYRIPFDASKLFKAYQRGEMGVGSLWKELWENLHHQNDVGISSYASIPYIAQIVEELGPDWNGFALVAVIENCRSMKQNPQLPDWLSEAYHASIRTLIQFGAARIDRSWSNELSLGYLMLCAAYLGLPDHSILMSYTSEEIKDLLREQ